MSQPISNHIKIGSSSKLSLSKGNLTIGIKGDDDYGPTSDSGFYNAIAVPSGGYAIYVEKGSQGPSIHAPKDDAECMLYLKKYGAPDGTISDMLSWSLTQSNLLVVRSQLGNTSTTYQNVSGSDGDTGFFFGGFRGEGLLDLVKVGFLANGTGVNDAPVTAVDRVNQTITISGTQFISGEHYSFTLDTNVSSFTIGTNDFSNYNTGYHVYASSVSGFGNTGGSNLIDDTYILFSPIGNVVTIAETVAISAGMIPSVDSYVWNVTWADNSTGLVRVGIDSGSGQIILSPIDTTNTAWQSGDAYGSSSKSGTFNFPATFTPYTPLRDIGSSTAWC